MYGVYWNGVQTYAPWLVKKVFTEAVGDWSQAIFDQKHIIEFVTAHPDQMLVIEIQVLKKMPGETYEPEMKLSSFREEDFEYDHV